LPTETGKLMELKVWNSRWILLWQCFTLGHVGNE